MRIFGHKTTDGAALITVILFGAIFIMLSGVLVTRVVIQERALRMTIDQSIAVQIAEAGLEKLKWHLAHNPGDYDGPQDVAANGDGEFNFTEDYIDPTTLAVVGQIEYTIAPEEFCGIASHAVVTVTGTSYEQNESYTLQQIHTQDTAANYAYIYNDDVRAGSDRFIRGRYHSNNDVEMNGQNDSVVSSSQTNGVYGDPIHPNAREDLWQDEVGTIDFNRLALDLETIRTSAIANGTYFNTSDIDGYEVEIVNDSDTNEASINVWELDGLREIPHGEDLDDDGYLEAVYQTEKYCGSQYDSGPNPDSNFTFHDDDDGDPNDHTDEDIEGVATCDDGRVLFRGTYDLDTSCPVAFFEGDVFMYGEADDKLLIASGLLDSTDDSDVFLMNTIDYESYDGSDGLTVVSEGGIKIPYSVPDDMGIRGIFLAQSGRYGRDYYGGTYYDSSCGCNVTYSLFRHREFLQTVGSIVSNEGGGTKWTTSGSYNSECYGANDQVVSGFCARENYYDRSLSRQPPPLTPAVSENFTYIEWRDQQAK